jgi:hypothetical protein
MLKSIRKRIAELPSELQYRVQRANYIQSLSALSSDDRIIVDALQKEGVYVTSLSKLNLASTAQMLDAARVQLDRMKNLAEPRLSQQGKRLPSIFTVTDLPEFLIWGQEGRLLGVVENYIGLPAAFQGVHLRQDFASEDQTGTLLWHKDEEDRRILKIIVYLNDVDREVGPFEYIPKPLTALYRAEYWRIYAKNQQKRFLGIDDQEMEQIIPRSAWKACLGSAGTVVFVDTKSVFHHGTLRSVDRAALFFVYTAKHPKHPELCSQYHDLTFARPELLKK